jgi:protein O-mannosyl-transferase
MTGIYNRNKEFFVKHRAIFVCLFLVMATLAVYWQVHSFEFVNYDDDYYVYQNRHVQSGLTIENIIWAFTDGTQISNYWIPLTWISHILDFQFYGMNAGGHHLSNLLFHIVNTLILFLVINRMTGYFWQSAFIAALFALHPLHVESVAWISERKDVLSTFFWLLTMLVYTHYAKRPGLSRYFWVLLFFVLGLMAKPMLVTLPFVLLLMDYWPLGRLQLGQASSPDSIKFQKSSASLLIGEKIPLFALTAVISIAAYITQRKGGVVPGMGLDLIKTQTANALVSYVSYIGKMIWPSHLASYYPHTGNLPIWQVVGAGTLLVSLSFFLVRWGRKYPYLPVGWFWYLGTLFPVIGLVKISDFAMADRYTYVPLIGIFIIIACGATELVAKWRHAKIWLAASSTVVLAILMAMTWKQAGYWKNSITLFEHAQKVTINNYLTHTNLGVALYEEGRTEEAIDHYLEVLRMEPEYAKAHYNLGLALNKQGHTDKAIEQYLQALRIKPDYADAHYNLGNALAKQGRTEEAIGHYLEVLRINPDYEKAYNNLGLALDKQGRTEEAIENYLQALGIEPDYVKARYNLGLALFHKGDIKGAIDCFREVLQIDPNNTEALDRLNKTLATFEEIDREISYIQAKLMLKPEDSVLNYRLGNLYNMKGQLDKSETYYQKAVSLQPKFPEALYELAKLHIRRNEYDKALTLYQKLIFIWPDNPAVYYNVACLYAKQNKAEKSVAMLIQAVAKGLDEWNHIKNDRDLDNIRSSLQYKAFIKGH